MRCFTVLGPSQSGKSSLVQALGTLEGRPETRKFSDHFALTTFKYLDEPWAALDVAGGTDHLGLAGQALAASDAAVLVVPPDPEMAPLTAPYLRLVEASGVPVFLFINRMDVAEARVRDIVSALQTYAGHAIVLRQIPIREGENITGSVDLISERAWEYREGQPSSLVEMPAAVRDREQEARQELLEHLADFNDDLLEQLIEDRKIATDDVFKLIADIHGKNEIIPALLGAASHKNGVNRLMKGLRHEAPQVAAIRTRLGLGNDAIAMGVYAENRKHVGKSVLLRHLGGGIAQGEALGGETLGSLTGADGQPLSAALGIGELAVAVKSDHLNSGKVYSSVGGGALPGWAMGYPPGMRRVLTPKNERDDARLSGALARIEAIDPGLSLGHDEESGHVVARLQGPMHLRRLQAALEEDFAITIEAAPVAGSYRETIMKPVDKHYRHRKQSGGAGQFADVHLIVKPLARGSGFKFSDTVKGGTVPKNYIPSVEAGAREALTRGPLGFPVVDVSVTLTDGKHHAVDSSDYAFKTAGNFGVRNALREAGPVLLQPIDQITVHVPSIYTGGLVTLVSSLKGQIQGFDPDPDAKGWDIFRALIPAPMQDGLFQSLGGLTHGTAWMETAFDHYEEIHGREAERVQAERAEAIA